MDACTVIPKQTAELLTLLKRTEGVTIAEAKTALGVADDSARNALKFLVAVGLAVRAGTKAGYNNRQVIFWKLNRAGLRSLLDD